MAGMAKQSGQYETLTEEISYFGLGKEAPANMAT